MSIVLNDLSCSSGSPESGNEMRAWGQVGGLIGLEVEPRFWWKAECETYPWADVMFLFIPTSGEYKVGRVGGMIYSTLVLCSAYGEKYIIFTSLLSINLSQESNEDGSSHAPE